MFSYQWNKVQCNILKHSSFNKFSYQWNKVQCKILKHSSIHKFSYQWNKVQWNIPNKISVSVISYDPPYKDAWFLTIPLKALFDEVICTLLLQENMLEL